MLLDFLDHLTCSSTRTETSIVVVVIMNYQVNLHTNKRILFLVTGRGLVNMTTFSSLYYK